MPSKKKLALVWHIKPANFCAVIAIAKLSSCRSFYIVVVCKKKSKGVALPGLYSLVAQKTIAKVDQSSEPATLCREREMAS